MSNDSEPIGEITETDRQAAKLRRASARLEELSLDLPVSLIPEFQTQTVDAINAAMALGALQPDSACDQDVGEEDA